MECEKCRNGVREPVRKAQLGERDGRTVVVLGVPVERCMACGEIWLSMAVAKKLDAMFDHLLAAGAESATAHWDGYTAAA